MYHPSVPGSGLVQIEAWFAEDEERERTSFNAAAAMSRPPRSAGFAARSAALVAAADRPTGLKATSVGRCLLTPGRPVLTAPAFSA